MSRRAQFTALLHKNVLLSTRNKKSLFGNKLSGWGGYLVQLLVPALFFGIMYLPKYFIPVRVCLTVPRAS